MGLASLNSIKDLLTMCYMELSLTTKYAIQRIMIFTLVPMLE
ncbi:Cell cycle control cwf11 [Gossypium arboreum]|uniref:Cell cycle control cwf11 n=1 Tax=Gossypium arboreum TaxID=29729 RepID=A0A0B0PS34_GOSAR|nr:Cell cycle control cwf11 [Gossypium arboreum]